MIFKIRAERNSTDTKDFLYDNTLNILSDSQGNIYEYPVGDRPIQTGTEVRAFSKDAPLKKSKKINILKIQLGLSCNYSCDYCSQKFVERPPETNKYDIDSFLEKLLALEFLEEEGLKIEFWGGEPFVYWKTLKPLAEALANKLPDFLYSSTILLICA